MQKMFKNEGVCYFRFPDGRCSAHYRAERDYPAPEDPVLWDAAFARGWDTAENITPTGSDAIALNSKSKRYWPLSNFHGAMGVPCAEMEYQASKWKHGLMRRPFRIMWER